MKTITDKETRIRDGNRMLKRSDLLKVVLDSPSEQGINIGAMRERIKILDKLDTVTEDKINLEDSEFQTVKRLYNSYGWAMSHVDIVDLADHLDEVEKQK